MTPFPKVKEYQKLKVGAYDQEEGSESEIHLYTTHEDELEDTSEEEFKDTFEDEPEEELQEEFSDEQSEQVELVSSERNWWDDYGSYSE